LATAGSSCGRRRIGLGRWGERLGLNVFGSNTVARHLYESLGYEEIIRQMRKDL
jgi:ribosomal protein S18 acetylase RimI-like enzyme